MKPENVRSDQKKKNPATHRALCIRRGIGRAEWWQKTPSSTKGRARSGKIMLIVCERDLKLNPK